MKNNSWLYQFYSLHSKMHFGLGYEGSPRISSYFPPTTPGSTYGGPGSPTTPETPSLSSLHPMHPYHHAALHHHSGITSLHGPTPSHHHYPHPLQYSPQAALPYPIPLSSGTTSPGSESDSSHHHHHQTSLKGHPSFPFFPSSAAFVCLC